MKEQSELPNPISFSGNMARPPWFYKQWLLAGNPALFFDRLINDYGDFIHYRGLFSFYLVNHPALVKQVLQETNRSFDKHSVIYNRFRNAFGNGLVVAEGDRWKRQRKLMQPLFGPIAVRRFFEVMVDATKQMTDRWESVCRKSTVFNVADAMNRLTLEIAGRALFSTGFDQAAEQIHHWTQVINRYSAKPPLPVVRSLWFPSRINRELKKSLREFHAFLQQLIDSRRHERDQNDLLSILLNARHEETGQPMTDEEIAEEVLGMIIGGHETSSSALTWIWYQLHQNPEIDSRLHEELDAVIGSRTLTLEDLPKLIYTKMVIDESMRLHPPFWFENRNAVAEVELGGVRIPQGAVVAFSRYSLHRHPDFWREPERFVPERFMPEQQENKRSTYAYVPFGGGPRICIGINFAVMELLVVLAVIAQRYRLVVAPTDRHAMMAQLTMTPQYGLQVSVKPR